MKMLLHDQHSFFWKYSQSDFESYLNNPKSYAQNFLYQKKSDVPCPMYCEHTSDDPYISLYQ